jgi:hypothetical protein
MDCGVMKSSRSRMPFMEALTIGKVFIRFFVVSEKKCQFLYWNALGHPRVNRERVRCKMLVWM